MNRTALAQRALAFASVLLIIGCTDLVTYHLADETSQVPPAAFPYALSKARLTTTFSVTLVNCDPAKVSAFPSLNLKVVAATAEAFEADPDERYYVDYTQLSTFWKSTNLKVSTAGDQTLQSVNTESSDQTLQISGVFLQTVASIAGAALIGNVHVPAEQAATQQRQLAEHALAYKNTLDSYLVGQVPQPTQPPYEIVSACSADAKRAVDELKAKKAALKALQAKTRSATGASSPSAASDAAISQAANDVADATKAVTLIIPITIEPKIGDFVNEQDGTLSDNHLYMADLLKYVRDEWVDKSYQNGWLDVSFNGANPVTEVPENDPAAIAAAARAKNGENVLVPEMTDVSFELFVRKFSLRPPTATSDPSAPRVAPGGATEHDGLVVRQPATGFFRACLGLCRPADKFGVVPPDPTGANVDLQQQVQVSVPQLGKKLDMPLHNGFGQDMSLALTLGPDGAMNILSFQDNSTIGAGLTAVGNAGAAYTSAVTARNAAITARNGAVTGQEGLAVSNEQIAVGYAGLAGTNASFADNALKAQADCIQQEQTIVKNGRSPTVQCPGGK
ncbi:hypothetical protein FSO04_18570 [Paraburkholderia madseniana]|uniref:Uncharacterized protein n=1 Tax=Paraburkholderia madseniana TaxID=2599607 RepID=A0A6N6WE80_9BURK|nr:hypothetical protein [Paraburkholderia madseniana]KAE8758401.1 hypothetical protein FSO04_18570 [Paraburkholderia madseniana]